MDPAYLRISLNQSMALYKICTLQELGDPESKGVTLKVGDEILEIVIVNWHGHLNAFQNSCPHTGIKLNWSSDQFLSLDECYIQCSTHGAQFRPTDGYCVWGPCAGQSLIPFKIKVSKGTVFLVV